MGVATLMLALTIGALQLCMLGLVLWVLRQPQLVTAELRDGDNAIALALDASAFLRASIIRGEPTSPIDFCHPPILVTDESTRLSQVLEQLETEPDDNLLKRDIILLWGREKRVISGSDILGFLLRGIVRQGTAPE